jgi:ATP-dependent Clp protease ATP-binding subunit ClpC
MENVQLLYDQAFQSWQAKETDKAKEFIEKALSISPDDLAIHALAMHIYGPFVKEYLDHAEFIVDRNIHYKDLVNPHKEPHGFLNDLVLCYGMLMISPHIKRDPTEKIMAKELAERAYHYTRLILENGYGIDQLDNYFDFLSELEKYDEIIDLGQFVIHNKTAAELNLPGLKKSEVPDDGEVEDISHHQQIMDAYFFTGRNKEAMEWCNKYLSKHPDAWTMYFMRGEVYCRLNQPEETARQWMIGTQMAGFDDWFSDSIDPLCHMVGDKQCNEKRMLRERLLAIKDKIPDDKEALFKKLSVDTFVSIGDPDEKLISESYIESVLGMKLPPVTKEDYFHYRRLWLPKTQGTHPYLPPDPRLNENTGDTQEGVQQIVPQVVTLKPITIERFGVNLTELVLTKKYPQVVGRDREIDALMRILVRMEKNNPVLLGEAGVGKTAIILGLAQRINAGNVPALLKDKRIIELSMSALVGGTMWRGDFETRITDIIKELKENTDIILFVDELHTIMGAGAANRGDLDVANIAKPALAKGEIRLVGATTTHEYSLYIEKDQAMARRFTPVRVAEMDREATLEVLKHRVPFWKEHHRVTVPEKTLIYAIDLSENHIRHRRFPDKVIDLLDESCAYLSTRNKKPGKKLLTLTNDYVNIVFREWTGTITDQLDEVILEKQNINKQERAIISGSLAKSLVSQPHVIGDLTSLILQVRHSVKDPVLPFVLLFWGQPGNGKTTAAAALEKTLWPNETDRLMVLNMAEYSDPFSYHRLVGSPPGYSGYNDEGILTARIKRKPFSIIMLKNIGEAHHLVIQFFASLFHSGMFTDKKGQTIPAGDIIFVLHFDIKTEKNSIGFSRANLSPNYEEGQVHALLKKHGFPSLWDRINFRTLGFDTLSGSDMNQVLNIHLEKLKYQYQQKGIKLTFSEEIKETLTNAFYALPGEKRNMETLIDQHIVPQLRNKMLKSKAKTIRNIAIK